MELAALFFDSFIIGFSGALMPGPVLAVGIAETPKHGWQTGPVLIIGHAVADALEGEGGLSPFFQLVPELAESLGSAAEALEGTNPELAEWTGNIIRIDNTHEWIKTCNAPGCNKYYCQQQCKN